jgi:general secretion pathway protein D
MPGRASAERTSWRLALGVCLAAVLASGCAASTALRAGERAEQAKDYDRAIAEYTNALRVNPHDYDTRLALDRAKMRASQEHALQARRLAAAERFEEALVEYQLASELNPTDVQIDAGLREARRKLRAKEAGSRGGRTDLELLIDRSRATAPPGLELPPGAKLPESLTFSAASSRAIFRAIAQFAGLNIVFDPAFREETINADLRNMSLEDALASVTGATRTFYRVTAQRTVTIIPDTPAKRREYEDSIVQTLYLSNADLKEVIDLLRIVVDVRQVTGVTALNAVALQDTPEHIAAAARLIAAIDKARPEVVIDVELLEVDRTKLREYGLQIASPGSEGVSGAADVNREGLTLQDLSNLTRADVFVTGVPGIYYRLLKNDTNTRILANPQLRTSEGIAAQAKFGEEVPVPVTTFAPIAAGGINQQPITSFNYRNIGVNIDITPRTHHDDEVSLTLRIELTSVSGAGSGVTAGLPTFASRQITSTIRLKDGQTNMLAGLIRDEERTVLAGVPGLSDIPLIGRLFARNRKEATQTDIILTLTPHIVRTLQVTEADLRPFRLGRSGGSGAAPRVELPAVPQIPRDTPVGGIEGPKPQTPAPPAFPQPLQPTQPGIEQAPGATVPVTPPPPKKPGGGGSGRDPLDLRP